MEFIELHLGNYVISHGYDKNNKEIMTQVTAEKFGKKLIAVSRIKSLSEKYVLTDYVDGRYIYWEYKEDYEDVKKQLNSPS
ncbi:hypothetical protein MPF19_15515 [Polaribacter sp. Z014]|uniref:hypothetical protein n=1 Tax=Polaribacter sp. Z014 TaxID=2927126 RepID=UPI0020224E86|nr:hypothetical protein [Polaribacter sp. Z014]MCL7764832.1 hypothetical protein [Polaribacter sp. Z014]